MFKVYEPGSAVTIDESLIPYRGRFSFRQYIKNKAHCDGIKIFKLCSGSGFTHKLQIYADKFPDRKTSIPSSVVLSLVELISNTGRTVCTDN